MGKSDSSAGWGRHAQHTMERATILIVDDQPDIRRLLSISLGADYQLIEAEDGLTALDLLARHQPSLVLLDVMLPGALDGLQVLDRIRAEPAHDGVVVAMLTACGHLTDQHLAITRGADAYFTKPFSPLAVRSWIRDALSKTHPDSDFMPL